MVVYIGILCSVFSLILGLIVGISALALNNGFSLNNQLASFINFHPDIMVFGVIGGLLITEKLELMENFTIMGKVRISRAIIITLFPGVFIASAGIAINNQILETVGLLLISAGSLLFLYYMTSRRNPGMTYIKNISGAAILSMFLASIANIFALINDSTELTFLALLFPVLYILAERMELGYVRGMKPKTIRMQSILAWFIVIISFLAVIVEWNSMKAIFMLISITMLSLVVTVSLFYDPTFRHLRKRSMLQSFMQYGIIMSFFWLFTGLLLFAFQIILEHGYLDPATHSIAIGFIGTFIVAHSPVIFPLTLKKKALTENVTLLPIIAITIATAMRVFGDLAISMSPIFYTISYISGYMIIVAMAAFAYNLKRIMVNT